LIAIRKEDDVRHCVSASLIERINTIEAIDVLLEGNKLLKVLFQINNVNKYIFQV
jgi:hypothetical protein